MRRPGIWPSRWRISRELEDWVDGFAIIAFPTTRW